MIPTYVPILKAKQGELTAYSNLPVQVYSKVLPLFDLPIDTPEKNRTCEEYLSILVKKISSVAKKKTIMIDISKWPSGSTIETGEHILNYMTNKLQENDVTVIPVIEYDLFDDSIYSNALKVLADDRKRFCLRLGDFAFEDMLEDEYFLEKVDDIIAFLDLDTRHCNVVLDLGDLTNQSIPEICELIDKGVSLLSRYKFEFISIAGSSITPSVNDMVPNRNSVNTVIRREMLAWQSCRENLLEENLVFGDYGVTSPVAKEGVSRYANGKVRYTIENNYLIVRGHNLTGEGGVGFSQIFDLSKAVVDSIYFRGEGFSWGDKQIKDRADRLITCGNQTSWVATDTNHHIHTVLVEIFEFESTLHRVRIREEA